MSLSLPGHEFHRAFAYAFTSVAPIKPVVVQVKTKQIQILVAICWSWLSTSWTHCYSNAPMFSVFHINDSRGSQVLKMVLGETFGGIIGCDYYGAYRKYIRESNGLVQYCMAHLVREVRFLAEHSHTLLSQWGQDLLGWLKKLFDTLHRRDELTALGFKRSMKGKPEAELFL